jgi:hypothetical protein
MDAVPAPFGRKKCLEASCGADGKPPKLRPADGEAAGKRREVEEPEVSMDTAAEVVEAMAVAEAESGWLCVPSYVVIRIDMSSAHLCTCKCYTVWIVRTDAC